MDDYKKILNKATIYGKKLTTKQKKMFSGVCQGKKMQMGGNPYLAEGGYAFLFDDDDEEEKTVKDTHTSPTEQQIEPQEEQQQPDTSQDDLAMEMAEMGDDRASIIGSSHPDNISRAFPGNPYGDVTGQASNSNAKYAFEYLQGKGLAPHIAAGIVGNLMQESGLRTNAIGDNGMARGIAQWHPDRFAGLQSFAKGRNPYSLETQLDYVVHEAKTRGDLQKLNYAKNSGEAAYIFAKHYERPKVIDSKRIQYAKGLHQ